MGENKFESSAENNPSDNPEEETEINPNEVFQFIEDIKSKCSIMGANDSEISELDKIKDNFSYGKISGLEAKQAAHNILESKQDYH